mmetsp:Transcript_14456/g.39848  ORF Transcript_14456/g.39848 Transcript_14456/m.39848 type:complete len:105 (+) Transcript_14456:724-1038(+)
MHGTVPRQFLRDILLFHSTALCVHLHTSTSTSTYADVTRPNTRGDHRSLLVNKFETLMGHRGKLRIDVVSNPAHDPISASQSHRKRSNTTTTEERQQIEFAKKS